MRIIGSENFINPSFNNDIRTNDITCLHNNSRKIKEPKLAPLQSGKGSLDITKSWIDILTKCFKDDHKSMK